MPDPTIEEINPATFKNEVLKFYAQNGIAISQDEWTEETNENQLKLLTKKELDFKVQKPHNYSPETDVDKNTDLLQEASNAENKEVGPTKFKDDLLPFTLEI
ncbi:hypothetical protein [Mycoplasma sp. ATU-Cv-508]|uniref:hypothetical protein n=1 Tax=Mycoplasma sp. ATU-Cv-508 TaxID=2048001 RepID=UPI001374CAE9